MDMVDKVACKLLSIPREIEHRLRKFNSVRKLPPLRGQLQSCIPVRACSINTSYNRKNWWGMESFKAKT